MMSNHSVVLLITPMRALLQYRMHNCRRGWGMGIAGIAEHLLRLCLLGK